MTGARDGYILVTVLGTLLVLTGLIASVTLVVQSGLRSSHAEETAASLDGLLRGGLELASYEVFTQRQPFAAVNNRALHLPGGSAVPVFLDEASRIDVNGADPALLAGAMWVAGVDHGEARAVLDRLVGRRGHAGREAVAAAMGAPAPNAPSSRRTGFTSVADFLAFAALDRAQADDLAGLLTVNNPDGKVDVLTASRRVLLALPAVSDAQVDALLADREAGAGALPRLKAALAAQAPFVKFDPGPCFAIDLRATDATGRSARRHGVIAAARDPDEPFAILAWEEP